MVTLTPNGSRPWCFAEYHKPTLAEEFTDTALQEAVADYVRTACIGDLPLKVCVEVRRSALRRPVDGFLGQVARMAAVAGSPAATQGKGGPCLPTGVNGCTRPRQDARCACNPPVSLALTCT